ncbi:hypothetical protein D3C72_1306450 [compost metagenome]
MVEVVALTGTLTHAGEHGQTAVRLGDVVDQFHHVDGLADAGAAEQADLAALGERAHQVDDLDAGFQQLGGRGLVFVRRSSTVDFPGVAGGDRAGFVDRTAEHVHDAAQGASADRHGDAALGVGGHQVALQAIGGAQRDAADHAVTELLLHFQGDFGVVHLQRVVHLRHRLAGEFDVDDGADDLNDLALTHCCIL